MALCQATGSVLQEKSGSGYGQTFGGSTDKKLDIRIYTHNPPPPLSFFLSVFLPVVVVQ